jgi:deazaflavin-dependent oxidoreductase (nitroreductase family)
MGGTDVSFDTPNGTRGGRQPSGRLLVWVNKMMASRVRKSGRAAGGDALVLTTVGRKSGEQRSTPVGWFPGGDGTYLIVASAAGGARNPAWYYNLAAHPDQVRIETAGKATAVTAEQLHGPARDEAWRQIKSASPRFAQYEQKTDRQMPVIRLTPHSR